MIFTSWSLKIKSHLAVMDDILMKIIVGVKIKCRDLTSLHVSYSIIAQFAIAPCHGHVRALSVVTNVFTFLQHVYVPLYMSSPLIDCIVKNVEAMAEKHPWFQSLFYHFMDYTLLLPPMALGQRGYWRFIDYWLEKDIWSWYIYNNIFVCLFWQKILCNFQKHEIVILKYLRNGMVQRPQSGFAPSHL